MEETDSILHGEEQHPLHVFLNEGGDTVFLTHS